MDKKENLINEIKDYMALLSNKWNQKINLLPEESEKFRPLFEKAMTFEPMDKELVKLAYDMASLALNFLSFFCSGINTARRFEVTKAKGIYNLPKNLKMGNEVNHE